MGFFTPEPATVTAPSTPTHTRSTRASARVLPEEGRKDTRATTPKDSMMRQTSGKVAALTAAVFCVLGLIWIPHQALAQGSSSESRSSSIADSTGANPVTINNSYSNFGATDTFTDTNGYSFNGVAINNADASASSPHPPSHLPSHPPQGSSSESRSSTIADSTGAKPVTINNAYTN